MINQPITQLGNRKEPKTRLLSTEYTSFLVAECNRPPLLPYIKFKKISLKSTWSSTDESSPTQDSKTGVKVHNISANVCIYSNMSKKRAYIVLMISFLNFNNFWWFFKVLNVPKLHFYADLRLLCPDRRVVDVIRFASRFHEP